MKKFLSFMALFLFVVTGPALALVEDINGNDVIFISNTTVKESIKANTWYTMYNQGRKVYAYSSAEVTTSLPLSGCTVDKAQDFLVRFIESDEENKFYIQTAEGSYYKDLAFNTGAGVVEAIENAGKFSINAISENSGFWSLKGANYYMDSNGSVVLGYGTQAPTSTSGNSSWSLNEVTLTKIEELTGSSLVAYKLIQGGLYRIQNCGNDSQFITEEPSTKKATTKAMINTATSKLCQMWIIEYDNGGFSLRNASTGDYMQEDYTCNTFRYYWNIQLSPNNTSAEDPYLILCHGQVKSGEKNCANLNGGSSGLTNWSYNNDKNSEWTIVEVEPSEVDTATVKANIDAVCNTDILDLEKGEYYQLISFCNGKPMTERLNDGVIITQDTAEKNWNQYWKITKSENGYSLQNIYSGKYIYRKATTTSSACGGNYTSKISVTNNVYWDIAVSSYPWETTYNIIEINKPTTGMAVNANGLSANADITTSSSQWILKRVDLTEEQLAEAKEAYNENELLLNTSAIVITSRLQTFFADYACTTLKDDYLKISDDSLRKAMSNQNLPTSMIRMALKIKNDTWGHREKEFRIYDYEPYSDPTKWGAGNLVGTSFQFSPQTGPTGISVKAGDIIVMYVNANPATGTVIEYSSVPGYNVYAERTALKRGVNVFTPNQDGFMYIHHTITNINKKIADVKPITVHIEGGRVQGYFDITRGHTNADWKDMTKNLFQDEIVHLKSKYYQYNMHYTQLLAQITPEELDEIDTDGCPKGIEGTLYRWDQLVANQHKIMGVEQFTDRFNCMLSASSSSDGNPYATSYGTYYPGVGTIMNYDAMTHGKEGDHGANYWCIAHETGHVHQALYNMAGCTEISNNNFSQINTWLQGSNTGRGGAWSEAQSSFHKKVFWQEYDLWQRSRAYFQLWLYFHLQKHDETFYPRLFDMFRKTPMTRSGNKAKPGSGTTDYLRFAKFACDVAQADLSEFFQFWGFFIPLDNYEVGDYSNSYFTTTQEEIDEAIAYMKKYPKKLGNILFIDERIEKYPADYPGMPEGAMRVATTPGVNPGDASVVGQTGMFTQFIDDVEYQQYRCSMSTTTGKVVISKNSGKGAVGFKVYNADHEMAYCYNTYNFIIPAELRSKPFYITVALGDGTDRLLYDPQDLCAVEDVTTAEDLSNTNAPIYNLKGQAIAKVQTGEIYIQNGRKFRMK